MRKAVPMPTEAEMAHLNYEGAMADCHAAVDELARCILRTDDDRSAWWLCANWAARVNCYPSDERTRLIEVAAIYGNPPKGGTWEKWFARPAVKATHAVDLGPLLAKR